MLIRLLILLFFCLSPFLRAQLRSRSLTGEVPALYIPQTSTGSVLDFADYVNAHFNSEESKARVVYTWLAENIEYDVDNMYSFHEYTDQIDEETLVARKEVCRNYAALFHEIMHR